MTQQVTRAEGLSGLRWLLRIVALFFFALAVIAGYDWGLASWHWEGLIATGLLGWCGSTLVP